MLYEGDVIVKLKVVVDINSRFRNSPSMWFEMKRMLMSSSRLRSVFWVEDQASRTLMVSLFLFSLYHFFPSRIQNFSQKFTLLSDSWFWFGLVWDGSLVYGTSSLKHIWLGFWKLKTDALNVIKKIGRKEEGRKR